MTLFPFEISGFSESIFGCRDMLDPGIDREAVKQPCELFGSKIFQLGTLSRPVESAFSDPLVQEKESVAFPHQSFYPVVLPPAEQEDRSCSVRIQIELLLYPCGKPVDPFAQICISALF